MFKSAYLLLPQSDTQVFIKRLRTPEHELHSVAAEPVHVRHDESQGVQKLLESMKNFSTGHLMQSNVESYLEYPAGQETLQVSKNK
jgi:hypothetical protein